MKSQPSETSFSSPLAHVLFATPPTPERAALETNAVRRFSEWLSRTSDKKLVRVVADFVDADLTQFLSGSNQLELAKLIEGHSPEIVPLLANVGRLKRHLEQVDQLSAVFAPQTIEKMIKAIMAEDQSDTKGAAAG